MDPVNSKNSDLGICWNQASSLIVQTVNGCGIGIGCLLIFILGAACGNSNKGIAGNSQKSDNLSQQNSPQFRPLRGDVLTFTWKPSKSADSVTSYRIYVTDDRYKDAIPRLVRQIDVNQNDVGNKTPLVELGAESEPPIEELIGLRACFTVTAVNQSGVESNPSGKTCVKL